MVLALLAVGAAVAAPVDFEKEIKPILQSQCVSCHGTEKQKGGLRLDAGPVAMAGGVTGKSIEPGKGKTSLLVKRLRGEDGEDVMPLKKPALSAEQIALFERWIDEGAKWPEVGPVATAKKHWAFEPVVRPNEPAVKDRQWARNAIDRFILAKLEEKKIRPSAEAPKETLLRRVHLDLTGLPPTPAEVATFVNDPSSDAYEKAIERLLASPAYGERWGRHWLDVARYADSNGYSMDNPRTIWPYRDWVINAINADMPFDRFVTEQLAGDLLPNATVQNKVATGFHRNTQINEEGGVDPEQFRVEAVVDRVATTATGLMGLTVACAQCHNHKFDPISQKDYYRFFAFFNTSDDPTLRLTSTPEQEKELTDLREQIKKADADAKAAKDGATRLKAVELAASLKKRERSIGMTTMVIAERPQGRKTNVMIKGDFTRPGDEVTPGVPQVLPPLDTAKPTRLDLSRWLMGPKHPLTARVTVNRIWQQYFGRGIVETENDFGTQGIPPTHPELLDWLATEFIRLGWSQKAMHRLIVTSSTYRQSSNARPDLDLVDPTNKLLARQTRLRLEGEVVRDVALSASGLLVQKVGGPSVYPPQPEGVTTLGQIKHKWPTSTGPDRYRRGMYTFQFRATPHPLLSSFDAPDGFSACTRRVKSNTPLQALNLLNDAGFVEFTRAFASRILKEGGDDRLGFAMKLVTGRTPSAEERATLERLHKRWNASIDAAEAKGLAGRDGATAEEAAWVLVARVLLNLDETITRE
jgi:hypothetical protein